MLRLRVSLIVGVLVSITSCGGETVRFEMSFSGLSFNSAPDDPTLGHQQLHTIYITPTDLLTPATPQTVDAYWTTPVGRFDINYETVFHEPRADGAPLGLSSIPDGSTTDEIEFSAPAPGTKHLAINRRGIISPTADRFLVFDELLLKRDLFEDGFFSLEDVATVTLDQCHGNNPNLHSGVRELTTNCTPVPISTTCTNLTTDFSFLPWTTTGCRFSVAQDSDQTLDVRINGTISARTTISGTPTVYLNPVLKPKVRIIDGARVLARRLRNTENNCFMRNSDGSVAACDNAHLQAISRARSCRGAVPPLERREWCTQLPGNPTLYQRYPGASPNLNYASYESRWDFDVRDGNRFTEDFSSSVRAEFVKVFFTSLHNDLPSTGPDGEPSTFQPNYPLTGGNHYLMFEDTPRVKIRNFDNCVLEAEPVTGHARFDVTNCIDNNGDNYETFVTPSRVSDNPTSWSIRVTVNAEATAEIPTDLVTSPPCPTVLPDSGLVPICEPPTAVNQIANNVLTSDVPIGFDDQVWIEFHMTSN